MADEQQVDGVKVSIVGDVQLDESLPAVDDWYKELEKKAKKSQYGLQTSRVQLEKQTLETLKRLEGDHEASNEKRGHEEHGEHGHGGARKTTFLAKTLGAPFGAGGELVHLAHLEHFLGAGGVIVGGMLLAVEAAKKFEEVTLEVNNLQREYNAELRQTVNQWQDLVTSAVPTTELGKRMTNELKSARDAADKLDDELEEMTAKHNAAFGGMWERVSGELFKAPIKAGEDPNTDTSTFGTTKRQKQAQLEAARFEQSERERDVANHRKTMVERTKLDQEAAVKSAKIEFMLEGPAKKRAALEQTLSESRRKLLEKQKDEQKGFMSDAGAAQRAAIEKRDQAEEHGNLYQKMKAGKELTELIKKQKADQIALTTAQQKELDNLDTVAGEKKKGLNTQINQETIREAWSTEDAMIEGSKRGHDKELALLDAKHNREMEMRRATGGNIGSLQAQQNAETIKQWAVIDNETKDMLFDMQNAAEGAFNEAAALTAAWEKKLHDLTIAGGRTKDQIDEIMKAFTKGQVASQNAGLQTEFETLNIEIDLAVHRMTALEAARNKLYLTKPWADPEEIKKVTTAQEKLWATNFAKEQKAILHPEEKLKEFTVDLNRAMAAKEMSINDAQRSLRRMEMDTLVKTSSGSFSSTWRAGQVDIGAVNIDPNTEILRRIDEKLGVSLGLNQPHEERTPR